MNVEETEVELREEILKRFGMDPKGLWMVRLNMFYFKIETDYYLAWKVLNTGAGVTTWCFYRTIELDIRFAGLGA